MAKLIGTNPDQVPTNADLGTIAYQDKDNLRVGTVTATSFTGDGSALTGLGGGTPSGAVIYHAANSPPTGFLKANGAAISRSTYSALFSAIGTTFGAGDGSSTFLVPDLRGEFLRGWDDSRGVDGSRSFGSAQAEAFKSHKHTSGMGNVYDAASPDYGYNSASRFAPLGRWAGTTTAYFPHTSNTGGSETRPRNIALLACIKY